MASERKIVRFLGPSGGLFVAERDGVAVCDGSGALRYRVAIDGVLDAVGVGSEIWVATEGDRLTRVKVADGSIAAVERISGLGSPGRFLQSSMLPVQPVWHSDIPRLSTVAPARAEPPPGPSATIALPTASGRWLLWEAGQLRSWRAGIGEAWRSQVGDRGRLKIFQPSMNPIFHECKGNDEADALLPGQFMRFTQN